MKTKQAEIGRGSKVQKDVIRDVSVVSKQSASGSVKRSERKEKDLNNLTSTGHKV